MKLIDLLVQELPKRGGWPDGAHECFIHCETSTFAYFYDSVGDGVERAESIPIEGVEYEGGEDGFGITRDQYESALAASQKVEWDGDGLPPVGCVCESQYKVHGSDWVHFECIAVDGKALFGWSNNTPVALQSNTHNFRPLCTEAERKRDEAAKAMARVANEDHQRMGDASMRNCLSIYDAIAAGKIPGVKLED